MRKCYVGGGTKAWFHMWGNTVKEVINSDGHYENRGQCTVAIVELCDSGQIELCKPEGVRFIDAPEN